MASKDTRSARIPGAGGSENGLPGFAVPSGRNHALFIAVGEYQNWPGLPGPARDVEKIRRVLLDDYGFEENCVEVLRDGDATRMGILTAFKRMTEKTGPDDRLLIYYAGHGHTDEMTCVGFWIPHDGGRDLMMREHWINNQEVRGYLRALPCAHVLLVSDSCFSGDLLDPSRTIGVEEGKTNCQLAEALRSREVLTSGASEPVSDSALGGMSPFAFHLADTLTRNAEGYLTPTTLYDRVSRGVKGQMPLFGALEGAGHQRGGAFVFYRKRGTAVDPTDVARPATHVELQKCPICGRLNRLKDTFECRACRREHLCTMH